MAGSSNHITDVRTVGVPVADQDAALAFYTGMLGFEKRMDVPMGPQGRWIEVAAPGATTSLALVAGAGAQPGTDTNIRLRTTDAAADHAVFRDAGVDVDPEIIPFPVPMFRFRDPDGNVLYVVQG